MGHKITEDIPVGTWGNKYDTKNPLKKKMLDKFLAEIVAAVKSVEPEISSIHEIGTGEGHLMEQIVKAIDTDRIKIKASDYSQQIVEIAKENLKDTNVEIYQKSVYELDKSTDSADLLMCCEVLEHLDQFEQALEKIQSMDSKYVILSVPNEPLWRGFQLLALNHITALGNTPGHVNHWSSGKFEQLVSKYFDIIYVKTPTPWTVVLAKKKGS